MRRLLSSVILVVSLGACGERDGVRADGAWIRLPAVAGRPAAAYFKVEAQGRDAVLVRVATPVAGRSELHESMAGNGGMMTMQPLDEVPLGVGEEVAFAPGGRHVMLFELTPEAQPGERTELKLEFASGRSVTVPARMIGAGESAPE